MQDVERRERHDPTILSDGLRSTALSSISVIVVSYNVWPDLERCLGAVVPLGHEVIVVDSASNDGTVAHVRRSFPSVRLIALTENPGYGGALNVGIEAASGEYLLVMNADAWPSEGAVASLAEHANVVPEAGIVGPRLLNPDGSLQPSVRGFPTLWRISTEYVFLRWLAPRSRLLNSFYGAGFDHTSVREVDFLMGAVLLVRRVALEAVGNFDTDFFMYSEEVDLCYRMRQRGWRVEFFPGASFFHVGGASARGVWPAMYREQVVGHLRFFAKHRGIAYAERARRLLVWEFRVRSLVFRGKRGRLTRETARWLASADVSRLLEQRPTTARGPVPGA
jgi:N-acetylglucosaminyl-diphospho-decaprenol L-rhamnosyltransferase